MEINSGYIILAVAVLALFYLVYLNLFFKRNKVRETLAGIDVQLTKRHDLIPNILTVAKKYMEHEKNVLEQITSLRSQVSGNMKGLKSDEVASRFKAEDALQMKMGNLFALMENYPNLKADGPLRDAIKAYQNIEDDLSASRRFYNSAVLILKNSCEIFPLSLVAKITGITNYPFYEAPNEHKDVINAKDYL